MARTQKKARTSTVFKNVTAADIERAETRGADVRRVWELQNVVTKKYPDLVDMPSTQVLKGEELLRFAFFVPLFRLRREQRFDRIATGTRK
jgi:hypothetical protein